MKKRAIKKTGSANIVGSMGAVESGGDGFSRLAWQGTLQDKIYYVADRYVNHGDATYFNHFIDFCGKNRSKVTPDILESLALDIEGLAGTAFFREIAPLIKDNARLEWLRDILAESLGKRWKLQIEKHQFRAKQSERGKRKRFANGQGIIARAYLASEIPRHKTTAALARHIRRDVKTVKAYAKKYGLELPSRRAKRR